jgi:hypothetical protein
VAFGGGDFWLEFAEKMFQPLLLFFSAGFLILIRKVHSMLPKQVYQGMVLDLLAAIGWHGGEELAIRQLPLSGPRPPQADPARIIESPWVGNPGRGKMEFIGCAPHHTVIQCAP